MNQISPNLTDLSVPNSVLFHLVINHQICKIILSSRDYRPIQRINELFYFSVGALNNERTRAHWLSFIIRHLTATNFRIIAPFLRCICAANCLLCDWMFELVQKPNHAFRLLFIELFCASFDLFNIRIKIVSNIFIWAVVFSIVVYRIQKWIYGLWQNERLWTNACVLSSGRMDLTVFRILDISIKISISVVVTGTKAVTIYDRETTSSSNGWFVSANDI